MVFPQCSLYQDYSNPYNSMFPLRLTVSTAIFSNKDDFVEFNFFVYIAAKGVDLENKIQIIELNIPSLKCTHQTL